jgi:hypothetical protein
VPFDGDNATTAGAADHAEPRADGVGALAHLVRGRGRLALRAGISVVQWTVLQGRASTPAGASRSVQ